MFSFGNQHHFEPRFEIFRHSGLTDLGFTAAAGTALIAVPGCQVLIPKGTLLPGRELEVFFGGAKSGAAETFSPQFHLGPLGTVADPVLTNFAPSIAATTRSFDSGARWKVRSNTTIQRVGAAGGNVAFGNTATTVTPAAQTIGDVTTTDLYLTMAVTMGGATEWITIQHCKYVITG